MTVNESDSYLNSPLFQEAMGNFRVGKWEEGFAKLSEVEKQFPMEPELRILRQEMEVRARISDYEVAENKHNKRVNLRKFGLRVLAIVVLVGIGIFALTTYWGWIQSRVSLAQSESARLFQQADLAIEFRNAQQLLSAGKSEDALVVYENIKAKNPDFPGLTDAITQAQNLKDVESQYTQAMNLLQVGDSAQALSILQEISQKMPNYRDVSLQIKNLQTQTEMSSVMQQADIAFNEGRYQDAISRYESLRLMDPNFQTTHIEEYLFQSYVKAAQALMASPVPTLETLKTIDDYFSKALALRPGDRDALAARTQVRSIIEDSVINEYVNQAQAALVNSADSLDAQKAAEGYLSQALAVRPNDPNVMLQFQLAQTYIQAVADFSASKWDSVIEELEYVVGQQAGYANGTALQTLFDAYIARGTDNIAAGEYALALDDFQRSAVLAQQLPDSGSQAFEAQIMIAEAQGLLNNLHDAVLIYQDALNTSGLRASIVALQNSMTDTLNSAERASSAGDYQSAFYAYRSLIRNRVRAYNQSTVVTVKSGDYLSQLARRYNTTVAAILAANQMNNQPRLTPNQQLIIPTLP